MEFIFGSTTYDFDEMTVIGPIGFWRIMFNQTEQQLFRIGDHKFVRLNPEITKAYLEYKIDQILLEVGEDV
jgi:hypothetical protein